MHQTINYVSVYQLIKQQMDKPTTLLETIAQNIAEAIKKIDTPHNFHCCQYKKIKPANHIFHWRCWRNLLC